MKYLTGICSQRFKNKNRSSVIKEVFAILFNEYGKQYWWPGDTRDEIIIGAVLTQNTAWKNVERSIENLRKENCLSLQCIRTIDIEKLKEMIKPSGFFNQKSVYLKSVAEYINDIGNKVPTREDLLKVKGVGKETCDSILLYAYNIPVFVVDAYTKRLFSRIGIIKEEEYDNIRRIFEKAIGEDVYVYNEYHALIVKHCKDVCKKNPVCDKCVLARKNGIYNKT